LPSFAKSTPRSPNKLSADFFFVRGRCLSAGLRSWVLLADQRGIEPPPAVCQRHKSAAIPTEPRGRLKGPLFMFRSLKICQPTWQKFKY
jgi:hypothetical protein